MAYLTRQQALDIINKAPSNLDKEVLLRELGKTNTIEGYNEQAPKSNLLKDIGREIVKPFAQTAEVLGSGAKALGGVAKAGVQLATGNKEGARQTFLQTAQQAQARPQIKVLGQNVNRVETGKQAVGTALNLASNLVGGGAVKGVATSIAKKTLPRLILQGSKQGAKAGFLYGTGEALSEDENVLKGGALGTLGGAVGGAVLPVAGKALKASVSPFSTIINDIAPKLDQIANKIETVITKPSKRDLAQGFKTENIFKYDLGGGLGTSLNKTQTLIDDLVVRAETMRGQSKSVIDLNKIVSEAADEIASAKISNVGNNQKILNAFKTWVKELEGIAPSGKVNTVEAQKIKVALGKMGSWLNGQRDLDSSAMESVSNILYTKFKQAVENAVDDPAELKAINKQLSELIPINNVLIKRIPIAERNNALSLTDIITAGAGVVDPKAWGLFAINRLSKSGRFASLLSKTSQKLKSGATKLLPLEQKAKVNLKNIKPGLTIEDVNKKLNPKNFKTAEEYVKANHKADFYNLKPDIILNPNDKKIILGNDVITKNNPLYTEMKDAIKNGVKMPPVRIRIDNNGNFIIKDGNNRITAMRELGIKDVPAYYDRRTLEDIWEKAQKPLISKIDKNYFYHGTNEDVLDSIMKDGLKPMMRGELSLSKTEDYANVFSKEGITPKGKTEAIMLRVNKEYLQDKTILSSKKRPKSDELNEVLTKETIPPKYIEIKKNGKWIPLEQWNKANK